MSSLASTGLSVIRLESRLFSIIGTTCSCCWKWEHFLVRVVNIFLMSTMDSCDLFKPCRELSMAWMNWSFSLGERKSWPNTSIVFKTAAKAREAWSSDLNEMIITDSSVRKVAWFTKSCPSEEFCTSSGKRAWNDVMKEQLIGGHNSKRKAFSIIVSITVMSFTVISPLLRSASVFVYTVVWLYTLRAMNRQVMEANLYSKGVSLVVFSPCLKRNKKWYKRISEWC